MPTMNLFQCTHLDETHPMSLPQYTIYLGNLGRNAPDNFIG